MLDRLEALAQAATPGPWRAGNLGSHPLHPGAIVLADGVSEGSIYVAECAWDATAYPDAELIAELRNRADALIEAARAAEEKKP